MPRVPWPGPDQLAQTDFRYCEWRQNAAPCRRRRAMGLGHDMCMSQQMQLTSGLWQLQTTMMPCLASAFLHACQAPCILIPRILQLPSWQRRAQAAQRPESQQHHEVSMDGRTTLLPPHITNPAATCPTSSSISTLWALTAGPITAPISGTPLTGLRRRHAAPNHL